jgi:threonine/homoserine/homoserine lactone efflux protein
VDLLKAHADCDFTLLKTPNTPNPKIVVLIVVVLVAIVVVLVAIVEVLVAIVEVLVAIVEVLVAIVEVLAPGVVRRIAEKLGRTPVVVIGKTATNNE